MNPYHSLVTEYARLAREGRSLPLGQFPKCPRPELKSDAPTALIFSPHPDDEVIIGALPLRLLRESGWKVVNVAVTQGSSRARQAARLEELRGCCSCIGFDLIQTAPNGLEGINVHSREKDPQCWGRSVDVISGLLKSNNPRAIFFPHEADWNSTHIGTHHLVMDSLKQLPNTFQCHTIETEFWGQMPKPNLVVESTPVDVADLITALTFHVGEVSRNPFHTLLPAWMQDNVRRGAELVGGQGGAAPDFVFATLYRLREWKNGFLAEMQSGGKFLSSAESPAGLF